jgi:5-methyltetrahydrofolate--homocysteine methyltransferase
MYDGAMGTMIQKKSRWLDEAAFRGERFADWTSNDKDNHDLLSLSQQQATKNTHLEYLCSGSRLISTNTFRSTTIAQADYLMEGLAYELNYASARLAHEVWLVTWKDPMRPRFVVGALGPTNRADSISLSV